MRDFSGCSKVNNKLGEGTFQFVNFQGISIREFSFNTAPLQFLIPVPQGLALFDLSNTVKDFIKPCIQYIKIPNIFQSLLLFKLLNSDINSNP
jgi:hypothetical protein